MVKSKGGPFLEYIGSAGEYRVMSELLLRHINPFVSRLDHGIDFMLETGKTIQVKSAHITQNKVNNSRYYNFALRGWFFLKNGVRKEKKIIICDLYIFWCINDNVFYIITICCQKSRSPGRWIKTN